MDIRLYYLIIIISIISFSIPYAYAQIETSNQHGSVKIEQAILEIRPYETIYYKISGNINELMGGAKLTVIITDPEGSTLGLQLTPTSKGYFETYSSLNDESPRGQYKVSASYHTHLLGSVFFTLKEIEFSEQELYTARDTSQEPELMTSFTGTISAPAGSSVPGCEETNECFIPADVTINVGGTVTWSNDDTAAHTVTSGTATGGPDGNFDSSLFMAGGTFSHTFDEAGEYPYFCMVHPWMAGTITVGQTIQFQNPEPEPAPEPEPKPVCGSGTVLKDGVCIVERPEFVDPNKDPSYYIDRYLNEPDYKAWFDRNYPNFTIFEAVGMTESEYNELKNEISEKSEPKVTDLEGGFSDDEIRQVPHNAYVDELYGFSIEPPPNWSVEKGSKLVTGDDVTLVAFYSDKFNSEYTGNFFISYQGIGKSGFYDLRFFSEDEILDEFSMSVLGTGQVKINKQSIERFEDRYLIDVEFVQTIAIEDEVHQFKRHAMTYIFDNGDIFIISMASLLEDFDYNDLKFRQSVDTFFVGEVVQAKSQTNDQACGPGTVSKDGVCVVTDQTRGGGCLIATATFGSELAPQVQQLREIRDNTLLETESGSAFMGSFNQFYYSFSPGIADLERENPVFKEIVKLAITPLISSLSILNYIDMDSESEVLGYGIGLILLNVGMYFVLPAIVIHRVRKFV